METSSILTELINYIWSNLISEGLIIIIICYAIGSIIKHAMPKVNNQIIVPVLSVVGAILAVAIPSVFADSTDWILTAFKGMTLGWASTGVHQFGKAILKLKGIDVDKIVETINTNENDKTE